MIKTKTLVCAVTALWMTLGSLPVMADGTLDGVVGPGYGAAVATDPSGDGAGTPVMDLTALYVYEGTTDIFFALVITGDIAANNWGKYFMYIETDNAVDTAPNTASLPWSSSRPINADGVNLQPKYIISTWVDSGGGFELHAWNGTGWTMVDATWDTPEVAIALSTNAIEWRVPKALLGNPGSLQLEAFGSGNNNSDTAIDTVPTDFDSTTWGEVAVLDNPTSSIVVPVEISEFVIE